MEGFVLPADIDERPMFKTLAKMKAQVKADAKEMAGDLESIAAGVLGGGGGGFGRGMISGRGVGTGSYGSGAGGIGPRGGLGMGIGPHQKYENLYARTMMTMARGGSISDDDQLAMRKAFEAKQKAARLTDPNFGSGAFHPSKPKGESPLERLILSSRINLGHFSPLLRDVKRMSNVGSMAEGLEGLGMDAGKAMSLAKVLAPAVIPITLAAMGVTAGVAVIAAGMAEALPRMRAMYATGGYGAEGGIGYGIGGGAGTNAASQAMGVAGALQRGGLGSAIARSHGIMDFGPYTVDKMKNYIESVDLLRRLPQTQATIMARDLGLQNEMIYRDMSNPVYNTVKNTGAMAAPNEWERRQFAEASGTWESIKNVGAAAIQGAGSAAWWSGIHLSGIGMMGDAYNTLSGLFGDKDARQMDRGLFGGPMDEKNNATTENTDAIKNMTRTLKDGVDAVGENGPRFRGAVPVNMKMMTLNQAANMGSMFNGAFVVG